MHHTDLYLEHKYSTFYRLLRRKYKKQYKKLKLILEGKTKSDRVLNACQHRAVIDSSIQQGNPGPSDPNKF